jgi:hypothetical protein
MSERATDALLFAFVVWQGVIEITAILGPLLPSITTDVETCHPPVELSPATGLPYGQPLKGSGARRHCHVPISGLP